MSVSSWGSALGVSIGSRRLTVALARIGDDALADQRPSAPESFSVPMIAHVSASGEVHFGEQAEARAATEPECVLREFPQRIGDDVPLSIHGRSVAAEDLCAQLIREVVDEALGPEGTLIPPLGLTYPASWTEHRLGLLRGALAARGLDELVLLPDLLSAVAGHADAHGREPGGLLAVYDLGETAFSTAVVREQADSPPAFVGAPAHLTDVGDAHFDDRVLRHAVISAEVDLSDDDAERALAQLRRDAAAAKERLSLEADAEIVVPPPAAASSIRLTRTEFEDMISADIEQTTDVLAGVIESARVEASDLDAILLIGASARIPLIGQLLSERFGLPLAIGDEPEATAALGALACARSAIDARTVGAPRVAPTAEHAVDAAGGRLLAPRAPRGIARPTARAGRSALSPTFVVVGSGALTAAIVLGTVSMAGDPNAADAPPTVRAPLTADAASGGLMLVPHGLPARVEEEPPAAEVVAPAPPAAAEQVADPPPQGTRRAAPPSSTRNVARSPSSDRATPPPRTTTPSQAQPPTSPPQTPPPTTPPSPPADPPVSDPTPPPADPPPADPPPSDPPPADPPPADPPPPPPDPPPAGPGEPSPPTDNDPSPAPDPL